MVNKNNLTIHPGLNLNEVDLSLVETQQITHSSFSLVRNGLLNVSKIYEYPIKMGLAAAYNMQIAIKIA